MDDLLKRLLEGKRRWRRRMRELPFPEKIKVLIGMQKRARGFDSRRIVWGEIPPGKKILLSSFEPSLDNGRMSNKGVYEKVQHFYVRLPADSKYGGAIRIGVIAMGRKSGYIYITGSFASLKDVEATKSFYNPGKSKGIAYSRLHAAVESPSKARHHVIPMGKISTASFRVMMESLGFPHGRKLKRLKIDADLYQRVFVHALNWIAMPDKEPDNIITELRKRRTMILEEYDAKIKERKQILKQEKLKRELERSSTIGRIAF